MARFQTGIRCMRLCQSGQGWQDLSSQKILLAVVWRRAWKEPEWVWWGLGDRTWHWVSWLGTREEAWQGGLLARTTGRREALCWEPTETPRLGGQLTVPRAMEAPPFGDKHLLFWDRDRRCRAVWAGPAVDACAGRDSHVLGPYPPGCTPRAARAALWRQQLGFGKKLKLPFWGNYSVLMNSLHLSQSLQWFWSIWELRTDR